MGSPQYNINDRLVDCFLPQRRAAPVSEKEMLQSNLGDSDFLPSYPGPTLSGNLFVPYRHIEAYRVKSLSERLRPRQQIPSS